MHNAAMRWSFASTLAAMAMSAGCYGPRVVECENGVRCPTDRACTENDPDPAKGLPLCGEETAVAACVGIDDYEPCDETVRAPGYCLERVCNDCTIDFSFCKSSTWQPMTVTGEPSLKTVWLVPSSEIAYAAGDNTILRYANREWVEVTSDSGLLFQGMWSANESDLFLADSLGVYRGLPPQFLDSEPSGRALTRIWGSSSADVVVVGNRSIGEFNGSTWQWLSPSLTRFSDVWGAGGTVVTVGLNEVRFRRAGSWEAISGPSPMDALNGVWFLDEHDVYVAGSTTNGVGTVWRYRWDQSLTAGNWETLTTDHPPLRAIWGNGPNRIYAVGEAGTIVAFDGIGWERVTGIDAAAEFRDIGGRGEEAMAVGAAGAIWRINP